MQSRLDERLPGEDNSLTLCVDACRDIAFLDELCNGVMADGFDKRGNAKLTWIKKHDGQPNDWRDCVRYGLALGQLITESGGVPDTTPAPIVQERQSASFVRSPSSEGASGGWIRRRSN